MKSRVFLEAVINVRMTREEKASLEEQARIAGMTLSALGRRRFLGHKVVARETVLERNELRRLGGLLKLVHKESDGAYSEKTREVLGLIEARLKALGA
jgi:hypothetical protein